MFGREPIFPIGTEVLLSDLSPAEPDQFENVTKKEVTTAMDSLHSFQKEMYSAVSENIADAKNNRKIIMIQGTNTRYFHLAKRFF